MDLLAGRRWQVALHLSDLRPVEVGRQLMLWLVGGLRLGSRMLAREHLHMLVVGRLLTVAATVVLQRTAARQVTAVAVYGAAE